MIVRYWGHKGRIFTWIWVDPKGWSNAIGHASADGCSFNGPRGFSPQFGTPAHALDECEPEIRDAHHRIAAGEDLAELATHTLSPGASGTFLPKTPPDAVTEPNSPEIGNNVQTPNVTDTTHQPMSPILHTQEGLLT